MKHEEFEDIGVDDTCIQELYDICFGNSGSPCSTILPNGVTLQVSFSKDHVGGLEGFYIDTYDGTMYLDNKAYYFEICDVFCDGTEISIERDEEADVRYGEAGFILN